MNKKRISKIAIGTGAIALIGAITYKLVKDYKEKKAIELMEEEYEEEIEEEKTRTYIKLPHNQNSQKDNSEK